MGTKTGAQSLELVGREFILAFAEHRRSTSVAAISFVNQEDDPAEVLIAAPRCEHILQTQQLRVATSLSIELNKAIIQNYVKVGSKAVLVSSSKLITVQGLNTDSPSLGAFCALPIQELGTEYVVVTHCEPYVCLLLIAGTQDHTRVEIHLRIASPGTVNFDKQYKSGDVLRKVIEKYDTFELQCNADLSGTYIRSNKPVAVFSGSDYTSFYSHVSKDNIIEQMIPLGSLGTEYISPFLPDLPRVYTLKVIGIQPETIFTIGEEKYNVTKFQNMQIQMKTNEPVYITSAFPILVTLFIHSRDFYKVNDVDVSFSILYPLNRVQGLLHLGGAFRMRGAFPAGLSKITDIWIMAITHNGCEDTGSTIKRKLPGTPFTVLGLRVPRKKGVSEFDQLGACGLYPGLALLKGKALGAMLPWQGVYVKPEKKKTFFCKTELWVNYLLSKGIKSLEFIYDYAYENIRQCCF